MDRAEHPIKQKTWTVDLHVLSFAPGLDMRMRLSQVKVQAWPLEVSLITKAGACGSRVAPPQNPLEWNVAAFHIATLGGLSLGQECYRVSQSLDYESNKSEMPAQRK